MRQMCEKSSPDKNGFLWTVVNNKEKDGYLKSSVSFAVVSVVMVLSLFVVGAFFTLLSVALLYSVSTRPFAPFFFQIGTGLLVAGLVLAIVFLIYDLHKNCDNCDHNCNRA